MIKYVSFGSLRPGADPEETWKYWHEKHLPWAMEKFLPEARRYTISRVVHLFGNNHDTYALAEVEFDDFESALRASQRLVDAPPEGLLSKRLAAPKRMLVQEEEVSLKPPYITRKL